MSTFLFAVLPVQLATVSSCLVISLPTHTLIPLLSVLHSDTSIILIHIMPQHSLKPFGVYSVFLK